MPSISMPSRLACSAWPSSCSKSETKKRRAAATANARYWPPEKPGFWEGKTAAARDQTMSAKTTSQLQLIPIRIPAIRPSWIVGFTMRNLEEGAWPLPNA